MSTNFLASENISWTFNSFHTGHLHRVDWIIPVTGNIFLTIVTSWILVSLIHYGVRTGKWRKIQSSNFAEKLNVGLTYTFVVVCAISCILRFIVSLIFMNIGFSKDQDGLCESIADAAYCSYALVIFSVVFFLWFRQRAFYTNRMLNIHYGVYIKISSYATIAIIVSFGLFVTVYNSFPKNYFTTNFGCIYKPNSSHQSSYWITAVVIITFSHITLLSLFAFALKHAQFDCNNDRKIEFGRQRCSEMNESGTCAKNSKQIKSVRTVSRIFTFSEGSSNENDTTPNWRRKQSNKKIERILKKTLIFAILGICGDIFVQVFTEYVLNPDGHRRLSYMIFDTSAFLNLLFVILSFVNYRDMMLSPILKRNDSLKIPLSFNRETTSQKRF